MKKDEQKLVDYWHMKFKESYVAKAPYTKKWKTYWDAYEGEYFKSKSKPSYKSDLVSNYVFGTVESIRPIMLDNDPQFQSMPRHADALEYANDVQTALNYEWDREEMRIKLSKELITMLVLGNAVFFVPWDAKDKQIKGIPISPFNLYPDPLATSVEDAEYVIYSTYKSENQLKQMFKDKAKEIVGSSINYSELVYENDKHAQQVSNQVLVLEVYTRDYDTIEVGEDGNPRLKYPYGRVMTIAPELGILLSDKKLPYSDARFPFMVLKDYDIPGKFWGEGEVAQLMSPQKHLNELNNAIIDSARLTANSPWIVDKNAGIPNGAITSHPGLVIRKNQGAEVRREAPAQMPGYVLNTLEMLKRDIEQISGVFDSVKGNSETGVYTAQGVLALQEAGQARIRLKVKTLEHSLGKFAELWFSRMKQFWTEERFISTTLPDGTYNVQVFKKQALEYDYDIKITAGSTMPVNRGAMLDLMIRLAQTPMPDGQNLVDREAVMTYLPDEVKSATLKRMGENADAQQLQLQQVVEYIDQQTAENEARDQETVATLQNIAQTIAALNKQILQLQKAHDKLEEERKTEEIRTEGYNSGYADAESLMTPLDAEAESMGMIGEEPMPDEMAEEMVNLEGLGEGGMEAPLTGTELPTEVIEGINEMTDDELAVLMMENPDLTELIGS